MGAASLWMVRQQRSAKRGVGGTVPDRAQRLLRGVAESIMVVAALRKRRNAAGERATVRRDIHQRPWPPAQRPRSRFAITLQAGAGFARGARSREGHPELARDIFRLAQIGGLIIGYLIEQRLIGARFADGVGVKEDKSLQMDLAHADVSREAHKGR